jgi:hypothetical protein
MQAIKLIRLTSGEEIIAEIDDQEGEKYITIFDPIVLIPAGEGKIGFMPFMPYTRAKDGMVLPRQVIMFMVEPIDALIDQFKTAKSGIVTPQTQKIIS